MNLGVLNAEIASSQKDEDRATSAKRYFEKAIENAKICFDYELEALCLNNLAVINTIFGKFDEAISNAENSIKVKDLMDNEMEMADSYLNIANACFKKGDPKTGLEILHTADRIIKKYNYTSARLQYLKIKSDICKTEKNYEFAYQYIIEHQQLKDSLEKINKEIDLKNNFIENDILKSNIGNADFKFPYMYLNILIIMAIIIITFAIKLKR